VGVKGKETHVNQALQWEQKPTTSTSLFLNSVKSRIVDKNVDSSVSLKQPLKPFVRTIHVMPMAYKVLKLHIFRTAHAKDIFWVCFENISTRSTTFILRKKSSYI